MKVVEKFTVNLIPDTLQLAYMGAKTVEVGVEISTFNDGSVRVLIPSITKGFEWQTARIDAFVESMDDLMVVAQIKNILEQNSVNRPRSYCLNILSTPYTRYDRPMLNRIDGFGAKVFADFVNSIGFDFVVFSDCHSEVMTDLVKGSLNLHQRVLCQNTVELENVGLICPDNGARIKLPNAIISFDKKRDLATGKIIGFKLDSQIVGQPEKFNEFLVVDDICEGGRTFIEVAKCFKENVKNGVLKPKNGVKLYLYVTHGIFSNYAIPKLLEEYDTIYTHYMKRSTYFALTVQEQEKVVVNTLINA